MLDLTVKWERLILLSIIGIMGAVCLSVIRQESITCDEKVHLIAGMSYLQRRDARMNTEHPPFLKVLAAIPLVINGPMPSYDDASWQLPDEWRFSATSLRRWNYAAHMISVARIPMIVVTLLLGIAVFFMARSLAGVVGGVLSLAVYASSPFFLAYGPLILTDVGIALFSLLTVWTFCSLWQNPDLKRAAVFGLSLSGALLSKFSSGLLLPTLVLLGGWFAVRPVPGSGGIRRAAWLSLLGVVFASAVVYATYGILFWRTNTVELLSSKLAQSVHPIHAMQITADLLRAHPWCERMLFPPLLYFLGVGSVLHNPSPHATYLLGHVYAHGTWKYFPVLFVYKMTPGFLCLVSLLLFLVAWKLIGDRRSAPICAGPYGLHLRALCLLATVFGAAALLSPIEIGIRHLSVTIAALAVLIALISPLSKVAANTHARTFILGIAAIAVIGNVYSALDAFPNYISYYNSFAGREAKYKIAGDSNLDWGQSLMQLDDFMQVQGIKSIALDTVASIPELYIAHSETFRCEGGVPMEAEWLAVSADRFVEKADLSFDANEPLGRCDYLFQYPHRTIAGDTLYVFRLRPIGSLHNFSPPASVAMGQP